MTYSSLGANRGPVAVLLAADARAPNFVTEAAGPEIAMLAERAAVDVVSLAVWGTTTARSADRGILRVTLRLQYHHSGHEASAARLILASTSSPYLVDATPRI